MAQKVKNPPAMQETWEALEWLPTPVFWPEEFHEQRSLVSYNPWAGKESDMTEKLSVSLQS